MAAGRVWAAEEGAGRRKAVTGGDGLQRDTEAVAEWQRSTSGAEIAVVDNVEDLACRTSSGRTRELAAVNRGRLGCEQRRRALVLLASSIIVVWISSGVMHKFTVQAAEDGALLRLKAETGGPVAIWKTDDVTLGNWWSWDCDNAA